MSDYESLLNAASQLPTSEKVQFIEALWESVPAVSPPPLSEDWLTEIKRRSDEFDAGGVKPVSWETVRDEALLKAGLPCWVPLLAGPAVRSGYQDSTAGQARQWHPSIWD